MDSRVAIVFYMSLVAVRRNRRLWRAKKANACEYGRVCGRYFLDTPCPTIHKSRSHQRTNDRSGGAHAKQSSQQTADETCIALITK